MWISLNSHLRVLRAVVVAHVLRDHADLHQPVAEHRDAARAAALRVHLDVHLLLRAQDLRGLRHRQVHGGRAVDLQNLRRGRRSRISDQKQNKDIPKIHMCAFKHIRRARAMTIPARMTRGQSRARDSSWAACRRQGSGLRRELPLSSVRRRHRASARDFAFSQVPRQSCDPHSSPGPPRLSWDDGAYANRTGELRGQAGSTVLPSPSGHQRRPRCPGRLLGGRHLGRRLKSNWQQPRSRTLADLASLVRKPEASE